MKKRNSLIASFLTLLLVNFASAYYGSYSSFSIRSFLSSIDPVTMTLGLAFFIVFALAYFALTRVIRNKYHEPNTMISGVLAFCIALFTAYWINLNGIDLTTMFYNLGFSSGLLGTIIPIILLIVAILLIWRLGFSGFLIVAGLLLIVATVFFDELIYEKGVGLTIGIIVLILGFMFRRRASGRRMIGRSIRRGGRMLGHPARSFRGWRSKNLRSRTGVLSEKENLLLQKQAFKRRRELYKKEKRRGHPDYIPPGYATD